MTFLPMEGGNPVDWKSVRRVLIEERKQLFDSFQGNPTNVRLAMEIMRLDDRIEECGKRIQVLESQRAA